LACSGRITIIAVIKEDNHVTIRKTDMVELTALEEALFGELLESKGYEKLPVTQPPYDFFYV
jgi:hypothetical protein